MITCIRPVTQRRHRADAVAVRIVLIVTGVQIRYLDLFQPGCRSARRWWYTTGWPSH